ncbi:MAG: hypothetical protein RIC55_12220 [Pirellulaceae bacterium]
MIHYSCDRCKRELDPEEDLRYVVRLEVCAMMEPLDVDDIEDDRDHLLEIQDILERLDDDQCEAVADDVYQKQRYDLCCDCYKEYIKNPLGRDVPVHLGFSPN